MFLTAAPTAQLFAFDLWEDAQHSADKAANKTAAYRFLINRFRKELHTNQRLHIYKGDSTKTVPSAWQREPDLGKPDKKIPRHGCALIHIDGSHDMDIATADLRNMREYAVSGALVVLDDAAGGCDESACPGPTEVVKRAAARGEVQVVAEVAVPHRGGMTVLRYI